MYLPKSFAMDSEAAASVLQKHGFGTLVSLDQGILVASHLPLLFDAARNRLIGHLARANSQWRSWDGQEVLAIFQGEHGYISPAWYVNQPAVPTWNYEAVHIYGVPRLIEESGTVLALLEELCVQYDPAYAVRFREELDPEWKAGMIKGIVAFEIPVARLEAKAKMNQNRAPEDVAGVVTALEARGESALAAQVRAANAGRLG